MDNFDLRKYLVENKVTTNSRMAEVEMGMIPADITGKGNYDGALPTGFGEVEYTLHLKNSHPRIKVDKKIKLDFKPLTISGNWDEDKLKDLFAKEGIASGTSLELTDSNNKVIKKGTVAGYIGNKLSIADKE